MNKEKTAHAAAISLVLLIVAAAGVAAQLDLGAQQGLGVGAAALGAQAGIEASATAQSEGPEDADGSDADEARVAATASAAIAATADAPAAAEARLAASDDDEDEQSLGSQAQVSLDLLVLTGKGVAVSATDRTDAHAVKVGVGRVFVATASGRVAAKAGVLFFDGSRYRLANVTVSNESVVAADVQADGTSLGSLTATAKARGEQELWVGQLSLNGTSYDLYIVSAARGFRSDELRDLRERACAEGENASNCTPSKKAFCADNEDDDDCERVLAKYWIKHSEDIRGRKALAAWCEAHPTECTADVSAEVKVRSSAADVLPPSVLGKLIRTELKASERSEIAVRANRDSLEAAAKADEEEHGSDELRERIAQLRPELKAAAAIRIGIREKGGD